MESTHANSYEWFRPGAHNAELPHDRDPRAYVWGLYQRDVSPSASLDVSFGEFLWFGSPRELVTYIREVEPQVYCLHPQVQLDAYGPSVEPVLARLSAPDTGWEEARVDINRSQDIFRVVWWGRFETLCSGSGDFELEFRREFRGLDGADKTASPIAASEMDAFIAFIGSYGA